MTEADKPGFEEPNWDAVSNDEVQSASERPPPPKPQSTPMPETEAKPKQTRKPRAAKATPVDTDAELVTLKAQCKLLENRNAKLKAMLVSLVEDL